MNAQSSVYVLECCDAGIKLCWIYCNHAVAQPCQLCRPPARSRAKIKRDGIGMSDTKSDAVAGDGRLTPAAQRKLLSGGVALHATAAGRARLEAA